MTHLPFLKKLLIVAALLLCSACSTVIFRADFSGTTTGPFSEQANGEYEQGSSPSGDRIVGSSLEPTSVKFVNSFATDGGIALMLAPNSFTASSNPVLTFVPVEAGANDVKRTFLWHGNKNGYMAMDCAFDDSTNNRLLFTLRLANGRAYLLLTNNHTVDIGVLPSPHKVWISMSPGTFDGSIELSPYNGTQIQSDIFAPNYSSLGGAKITVRCAYNGFASPVQQHYIFDNLIFRSN